MSPASYPSVQFSRRGLLRAAGLSAAALGGGALLGGCGDDDTDQGATGSYGTLAIQLSWIKNIEFAGEYFADTKGYFKEAGFSSVNLLAGGVGATSAEAMVLSKSALVGLSAPNATAPAIVNEQAPLKIIGSTFQKNPFCIVSLREGKPITTPAEMAGKRIGVQTGTNEEIFAGLLKANGMSADDLTIVPVQFDPMVVATKDVDGFMAYVTNEPILLKARGYTPVTFLFADHGLPLTAETFTVLQEEIDNNRAKLKAFLKAELRGWTDAVSNPEESARLAVEVYGKEYDLNLDEQIEEMKAQNGLVVSPDTEANGLFTMTDELIEAGIKALNTIDIPITAEQLYDFTLLEEVLAENPQLKG